jgi:hypothetical protein
MNNIPKDVEKYLVKDEIVDKQFYLNNCSIFTSKNRMYIKKGNTVKDISYAHISSVESQLQRKWSIITIGILLIVVTFLLRQVGSPDWVRFGPLGRLMYGEGGVWFYYSIGVFFGVFSIVVGYIWKTMSIKLSVSGVSEEQVIRAEKQTLDILLRLVNERRLQVVPNQAESPGINKEAT